MSSNEGTADARRQSSRLKSRPLKILKDFSEADLSFNVDGDGKKDVEMGPPTALPAGQDQPASTTSSTTRRRNLKRVREEESFRIGNDIEPPRKRPSRLHKLLLAIPLDVLYSIFSYLPPKSLLSLARVNRVFRSTLLSPETTFIWTRVRKSCKAPEPWEGMGEVEWVRLLFGGTNCQNCGSKNIHRVNFILMKRICFGCVKTTGVSKGYFKYNYPDDDKKVLDLVRPTDGGRRSGHTNYYHCSEIDHVLEKMKACKDETELAAYIKEREEYLERLAAHAKKCAEWMDTDYGRQLEDAERVRETRFAAIKLRLKDLGYVDEDIESIRSDSGVAKDAPLTEQGWSRMKTKLVESVLNFRVRRLLSNHFNPPASPDPNSTPIASTSASSSSDTTLQDMTFVTSRCALVADRYYTYKLALSPSEWRDLPLLGLVYCLPSMKRIIGLPDNVEVTPEMVQAEATDDQFAQELRESLARVKEYVEYDYSPWSSGKDLVYAVWSGEPIGRTFDYKTELGKEVLLSLDPATVQGRCCFCRQVCSSPLTLVGHLTGRCFLRLDEFARPDSRQYYERMNIFYSKTSSGLVVEMSGVTGLAAMVTPSSDDDSSVVEPTGTSEMDERGAWYRCLRCLPQAEENVGTGIVVDSGDPMKKSGFMGTWRECIIHAYEGTGALTVTEREENATHRDQTKDNPAFQILSEDEVAQLGVKDNRKCWSCAHCPVNAAELWARDKMMDHLTNAHAISEPHIPKDFLYLGWDERSALTSTMDSTGEDSSAS